MVSCRLRIIILALLIAGCHKAPTAAGPEVLDWPQTATENRPGCIWWWMGSAVDSANITWDLETMRRSGIGGVTLVPIYGVRGCEEQFIQYLSPRWLRMMSHAVNEAERLGMWIDMTSGTGWPFGGPMGYGLIGRCGGRLR